MKTTGLLVTFEGIEGSGKSTQIELTRRYVEEEGYPCRVTREPGGTVVGEEIRTVLLKRVDLHIDPHTELLLIEADRAQHVAEVIRPALGKGDVILCDRYTDSTIAYQGYGRGLDIELVAELNRRATGGITPHRTIVLDCPVEVGMARAEGDDRFEREGRAFHRRVREGYLRIAEQDPQRVTIISGQGDPVAIQREIKMIIRNLLARRS